MTIHAIQYPGYKSVELYLNYPMRLYSLRREKFNFSLTVAPLERLVGYSEGGGGGEVGAVPHVFSNCQ